MFSISRSFWPFSNNSRLFQDFRRLTKMCEDCQRCQKTTEHFQEEIRNSLWPSSPKRNSISISHCCCVTMLLFSIFPLEIHCNRPIRLTQCCTQFKSLKVKVLCVIMSHSHWNDMEILGTKRFIPKLGTTLSQPNRSIWTVSDQNPPYQI